MYKRMIAVAATALVLGAVGPAAATEHQVQMLNKGAQGMMVFEPAVLQIAPGDTVRFLPTDRGHNAALIKGMAPDGAQAFAGKMNEEFTATFDQPGVYGYECKPHYGMGMVGLIVVGDPVNLDDAKGVTHRGRAKQRMQEMFTKISG